MSPGANMPRWSANDDDFVLIAVKRITRLYQQTPPANRTTEASGRRTLWGRSRYSGARGRMVTWSNHRADTTASARCRADARLLVWALPSASTGLATTAHSASVARLFRFSSTPSSVLKDCTNRQHGLLPHWHMSFIRIRPAYDPPQIHERSPVPARASARCL